MKAQWVQRIRDRAHRCTPLCAEAMLLVFALIGAAAVGTWFSGGVCPS